MEVQLSGITTAPVELGSIAQSPATAAAIISKCTTTAAADWTGCRRGMRPRWNRATPCVSRRGPWWNLLPNLLTDIMYIRLVASVGMRSGSCARLGGRRRSLCTLGVSLCWRSAAISRELVSGARTVGRCCTEGKGQYACASSSSCLVTEGG